MTRLAPRSTLFPYTTLFRSAVLLELRLEEGERERGAVDGTIDMRQHVGSAANMILVAVREHERSEEHTSELQSQSNLVCRLLLEKKKQAIAYRSRAVIYCFS